jgi:hypothetical protein
MMLFVMLSGFFSACYFVLLDALGREKIHEVERTFEVRARAAVAASQTSFRQALRKLPSGETAATVEVRTPAATAPEESSASAPSSWACSISSGV